MLFYNECRPRLRKGIRWRRKRKKEDCGLMLLVFFYSDQVNGNKMRMIVSNNVVVVVFIMFQHGDKKRLNSTENTSREDWSQYSVVT